MKGGAAGSALRSVISNAASLAGGRVLLALIRFVVALVIVQRAGLDRFGEFALVLSFILLAEWLSDFGLGDIAVRQVAANPGRGRATLAAFVGAKAVQGLAGAAVMYAAMRLIGYGPEVARAGLVAGLAVILYAGVQVYRVMFRTQMRNARDIGAEVISALVFLAAVAVAVTSGPSASVVTLTWCYVLSRLVNLAAAAWLAGGLPAVDFGPQARAELKVLALSCVPLGITGLMVAVYDAMDAIALDQWATSQDVGIFTVAMRILMFAVVVEQALATAVFPLLAAQWAKDREAFRRSMQAVLDWGTLVGGALFCGLYAGALGLATLARQNPAAIAEVLQLLSWVVLARVVVTLIGPMLVISGRLRYAIWIPMVVVAAKWTALTSLAPDGAIGAAKAYLIAEIGVSLLPNLILCQWISGVWLNWSVAARVVLGGAAVAVGTHWLGLEGRFWHGIVAAAAYFALVAALGAVHFKPLAQLLDAVVQRRKRDG